MNRPLRITLLTVLAVALVAAGAVGGALYAHEEPQQEKKFSERSEGSTCMATAPALDRLVPASPYTESSRSETREELRYKSTCTIAVDGEPTLRVAVEQGNSERKSDRFAMRSGKGRTKSIPGFERGRSSQDIAIVDLPCTKKTDDDDFTRLYVRAQAWGKNYPEQRGDMVRILKRAAKKHHHFACVTLPGFYGTT